MTLEGRTCIITGANSGIGKETALALAQMRARVVMVCRNKPKGEAARREISRKTGSNAVDLLICDLSSFAQVRRLADEVKQSYERVHVLINNAGLFSFSGRTEDGLETTMAVNYFAPFLLTNLLLDPLKESAPSRIVSVSSAAHYGGHIDIDDVRKGGTATGWGAYSNSKLAVVMFTHELARRLNGTGVTANCLHPGAVATGMWRIPSGIVRPFMRSAKKGAETSVYLASSPEVEGVSGEYFDDKKVRRSSEESYDEEQAKALWDATARVVGLPAQVTAR